MSALDNTPNNRNFQSPLNFQFNLKRAPTVNFFIQKVNIPAIYLPKIENPTEFIAIPTEATHLKYDDLRITFKVDEDFLNYLEIYKWITDLGFPRNFEEYKQLKIQPEYTGAGLKSDISLIILNSAKNPTFQITYTDAFPSYLGDLEFDTTNEDINYLTVSAAFSYTYFKFDPII